ncbi:MAG: cytochrome c oxidase assembly protein [Solirubrobacterales bacterium]|nr:cytochrome c oxidase assembly protein [Solirubrobacterales bacterium]
MSSLQLLAAATPAGPDAGSPLVALVAAAYLAVYVWRWLKCQRDSKVRSPGWARLVAFSAGCLLMAGALGPPLDRWAEQSATMHMVQHVILLDFIPLLLFAGLTKAMLRPATKLLHGLEDKVGFLATPAFAVMAYCGAMFFWHVPPVYDSALKNGTIHAFEHITLLTAGLLYWWHLISPVRVRYRLSGTGPVLYMATTKILVGILGIVLIYSPRSLYAYTGTFLGMDPLTDQHVAGAVMATEQTFVMGVAFALLFLRMLADSERRQVQKEKLSDAS